MLDIKEIKLETKMILAIQWLKFVKVFQNTLKSLSPSLFDKYCIWKWKRIGVDITPYCK